MRRFVRRRQSAGAATMLQTIILARLERLIFAFHYSGMFNGQQLPFPLIALPFHHHLAMTFALTIT